MKSHKTHQPYGGDAPRGRVFGRSGGPTGTFWPKHVTLRGCICGTAYGNTHGPLAGGVRSLTCQSGSQWVQRTKPATGANSPCWPGQLIKLEWAHTERATGFRDLMRGADWWRDITWGSLTTRGDSRGYPPWVHFFGWDSKSWREVGIGSRHEE